MPIEIESSYYRKIFQNEAFVLSEKFESVSSGGTKNIHIANPADSARELIILDVTVSGTGDFEASIHDDFSSGPSGGTDIETQNVFLDSTGVDDDGVSVTEKNVSFTDGGATYGIVGGGAGGNSVGGVHHLPTFVIAEDREIVVKLENTTSEAQDYTITVIYFQKRT